MRLLKTFLHGLTVYKYPQDFIYNRDTYFIESLNNATLQYLDKRIHFSSDDSYKMRYNLCILDWNEHVERPFTSISKRRMSVEHSRRQKGSKVYKKKTFRFVQDLWNDLLTLFKAGKTVSCAKDIPEDTPEDTDASCESEYELRPPVDPAEVELDLHFDCEMCLRRLFSWKSFLQALHFFVTSFSCFLLDDLVGE